jgi:hypothetical protein
MCVLLLGNILTTFVFLVLTGRVPWPQLTSFLASLDDIPLEFVNTELSSAQAALNKLDAAALLDDVQSVFTAINNLPDFTELASVISSMEEPLAQVKAYVTDLHDVDQFIGGAGQFFTTDLSLVLGNLTVSPTGVCVSLLFLTLFPFGDPRWMQWSLRAPLVACPA